MYTFKLQAVLNHRKFVEDGLKKELANIRQQLTAAQQARESLKRIEMDTAAALKQEQATGLSSDGVVAYHAYLRRIFDRLAKQAMVVRQIKEQESEKQGSLLTAVKRRQMLEKLKGQGIDRYQRTMLKKEMDFIDEIAVHQYVRKTIQKNGNGQ